MPWTDRDSLIGAGLMTGARAWTECNQLLLRLGKEVQPEKRNVPDAYVFYTLASVLPKAEIISAHDRSERAGSDMPVICKGAHPALLPLDINVS